jgi:hypothetical protein
LSQFTSSLQHNSLDMLESVPLIRLTLAFAALTLVLGCSRPPVVPDSGSSSNTADKQAQSELIRQQIDLIPPPSKARYMAIRALTSWENPYLTVQGSMLTLHVTLADANTTDLGVGGILRPVGARRQDLNIRVTDLPGALNAVPRTAWPYGRVVALEEAHDVPAKARPEVRRNMETAMNVLNDLGVVVYEWNESGNPVR